MRARPGRLLALAACVAWAACASAPRQGVTEAFRARPPRSVHVLVPTGTTEDGAARRVEDLLRDGLRHKGYRLAYPADATLSTRIELWDRQLRPGSGTAPERVSLSAELVQGTGGKVLWRGEAYRRDGEDEQEDGGRAGALDWIGSAFDYAFETVTDPLFGDHERVAKDAVAELLASLPDVPGSR